MCNERESVRRGSAVFVRQSEDILKREIESVALLPENARFVRSISTETDCMPYPHAGMVEFEAIGDSRAYRDGQHFHLTPLRASLAYGFG